MKRQHRVMDNINSYVFGVRKAVTLKKNIVGTNTDNNDFDNMAQLQSSRSASDDAMLDAEQRQQRDMQKIQTFNLVKNAIWSCVFKKDDEADADKK